MPGSELLGTRVAILVENGFEQIELGSPRDALEDAGAETTIVSPVKGGHVRAWKYTDWGDEFDVDKLLDDTDPVEYTSLLLPGGVMNPDKLRMNPQAVEFVKHFFTDGKAVAAICHGPWTIIDAGAARGRTMTSWPSLKSDLRNAGTNWVDQEVVIDRNLVTSRKPDDLPAFNREMIKLFQKMKKVPTTMTA